MSSFTYFPTPNFAAKMEKIAKFDPSGHARILEVIERLLRTPDAADGWMHGLYHGKLKKYVGRRDYRLIYHWCELCRKQQKKMEEQCGHCHKVQDHTVIFFDVFHKNEINRL